MRQVSECRRRLNHLVRNLLSTSLLDAAISPTHANLRPLGPRFLPSVDEPKSIPPFATCTASHRSNTDAHAPLLVLESIGRPTKQSPPAMARGSVAIEYAHPNRVYPSRCRYFPCSEPPRRCHSGSPVVETDNGPLNPPRKPSTLKDRVVGHSSHEGANK